MAQQQAHRDLVTASVQDLSGYLQDLLSRRLTAYVAGVRDAKTVSRWANGTNVDIRSTEVEVRLRNTFYIARLLSEEFSPATVKSWFVSMNPYLADVSPLDAIREGRAKQALEAARIFISTS